MLADHAKLRRFRQCILEAVGQPVGHRIAEHQHVLLGHGVALGGRGRARIIHAGRLLLLLLAGPEHVAERRKKSASATARGLRLRTAAKPEIEELRRRRSRDPEQHGARDRQNRQGSAFGEQAQERRPFRHASHRFSKTSQVKIIADSGPKWANCRADDAP